jgi:hypothetical protein
LWRSTQKNWTTRATWKAWLNGRVWFREGGRGAKQEMQPLLSWWNWILIRQSDKNLGRKETEAKPILVAVSLFMFSELIAPLSILMLSSRITNRDFLFVYSPFEECYSNKKIHRSNQIKLLATIPSSSCI